MGKYKESYRKIFNIHEEFIKNKNFDELAKACEELESQFEINLYLAIVEEIESIFN